MRGISMKFGSVYLIVKDFDKSVSFYQKVLEMEVTATNGKRFAVFHSDGFTLCLMNGYYDDENRNQVITKGDYWEIYDNQSKIANDVNTRKVFINLGVEDLAAEYNRIKRLGIAEQLTEIRYIHVFSPYWYFSFLDPDGNPIEVTGDYKEECDDNNTYEQDC